MEHHIVGGPRAAVKDLRALPQFPTAKHQWHCLSAKISRGCQPYMLDFLEDYWFQTFWANVSLSSSAVTLATIVSLFSHHSSPLTDLPAPNLTFLPSVLHTAATPILLKSKTELASPLIQPCTSFLLTQDDPKPLLWSAGLQSYFLQPLLLPFPPPFCSLSSSHTPPQSHISICTLHPSAWSIASRTPQIRMARSHTFRSWLSCHLIMEAFPTTLFKITNPSALHTLYPLS